VDAVFHEVGEAAIERMADWERSVHIYRAFRAGGPVGDVAAPDQEQKED
jgi:hypothetical protein